MKKNLPTLAQAPFKRLVTGGCSFSENHSEEYPLSWPYYLSDLLGIEQVTNVAAGGMGNRYISDSVHWLLETQPFDPAETLVVVMWSGFNRHSYLTTDTAGFQSRAQFTDQVHALNFKAGGIGHQDSQGLPARAVQNYLYISNLYHYLRSRGYTSFFVDWLDRSIPNRSNDQDIVPALPPALQKRFLSLVDRTQRNFYEYAVWHDQLQDDDFHPNMHAHHGWTTEVLAPWIIQELKLQSPAHDQL